MIVTSRTSRKAGLERIGCSDEGLPGEPRTLDPQLADDTFSFQVVWDLFEGLTALERDGTITPGIASSWTLDPTGTIYIFSIRPEAKWSDGENVLEDEFVAGFRRAVDPKTASGFSSTSQNNKECQ